MGPPTATGVTDATRVGATRRRYERIRAVLACPTCHGELDDALSCDRCGTAGQRTGTQVWFGGLGAAELRQDPLNRIKESVKRRFGWLYPAAINVLSPVLPHQGIRAFLRSFDLDRDLVADLGSGTHRRDARLLCIDGGAYDNVDVVADLRTLPIASNSLAGGISNAVLEHVPDPANHVAEMYRVLRPGGRILCFVPFMQPFHASPYDFQRYTDVGMRELFSDFEVVGIKPGAGPTSALLWVLQEWLALTLSFGSRRLYRALVPLLWLLSPLKLLDLVLVHHPAAGVIASGFVIEVRKPTNA